MKKQKLSKKIIIITGTPCTGKTFIASKLSLLLKAKHIEVNKLLLKQNLADNYDKTLNTNIIDIRRLKRFLKHIIVKSENSLLIDSHLSHYLPNSMVDLCIVTKCPISTLNKRLKARNYRGSKIRDNLNAEIFETCLVEAQEEGHTILEIDTKKKIDFKNLQKKIKNLLKKTT